MVLVKHLLKTKKNHKNSKEPVHLIYIYHNELDKDAFSMILLREIIKMYL